ncbi:Calmodulin [Holothuria leucospilota]|uniref:Calmodulin n=1 Tax=Holothuria leucospilota TaxID=206669 RepID=A0A9Q1CH04_HOLLE|nr:Calmodulin [Holothuria leucospilota]
MEGVGVSPEGSKPQSLIEELNKEQILEFREAFETFDRDHDGVISVKELKRILKMIGLDLPDEDVQDMFDEADQDGNGTLDFVEFMAMVTKKMTDTDVREDIKEAFKVFDKKGVGFLTTLELREIMMTHGDYSMSLDEVDEMISHADMDGDGSINYEEFVKVLTSTAKGKHLVRSSKT